jgi:hypothetical protein
MAEIETTPKLDLSEIAKSDLIQLAGHAGKLELIAAQAAQLKIGTEISEVERTISEKSDLPINEIRDIFQAIWNLNILKHKLRLDSQRLLGIVTSSLEEQASQDWIENNLEIWNTARDAIAKFLDSLQTNHPLVIARKAEQLKFSHQNLLNDAKIITDLRPVFDSSAKKPEEFIITHSLMLNYYDGTEIRRIAIAVDENDIQNLRRVCERAIVKEETLNDHLKKIFSAQ